MDRMKRFWRFVEKTPGGCWNWTGSATTSGYGAFYVEGNRRKPAHRWLMEQLRGALDRGKMACHTCDNRLCVNPDHLYEGTAKDNTADAITRGRLSSGDTHYSRTNPWLLARGDSNGARKHPNRLARGITSGRAKLDDEKVRTIRQLAKSGAPHRGIARQFGVTKSTVTFIVNRRTWGHVD